MKQRSSPGQGFYLICNVKGIHLEILQPTATFLSYFLCGRVLSLCNSSLFAELVHGCLGGKQLLERRITERLQPPKGRKRTWRLVKDSYARGFSLYLFLLAAGNLSHISVLS